MYQAEVFDLIAETDRLTSSLISVLDVMVVKVACVAG